VPKKTLNSSFSYLARAAASAAQQSKSSGESSSTSAKQRGVALISVLLVVAILVALSSQLLSSHNLVVSQHQNSFEHNQALQYIYGAEEMTRQLLFDDFSNSGPSVDHLQESWAKAVIPFELDEGGFLEAQVRDLNGCFNVNSLNSATGADNIKRLKRMLQKLGANPGLADLIKDWLDIDQSVTGFGAEDNIYLGLTPPYRAANQLMQHISELFLLDGISSADIEAISPHLCILPNMENKVNVNTAEPIFLYSLDPDIAFDNAEQIVDSEPSYTDVKTFVDANAEFQVVEPLLSVTSEYFELHAKVQVGESSISVASLFFRNPDTGVVTLLQRDFAKTFQSNFVINVDVGA
jgi:general secretion pathway protein K